MGLALTLQVGLDACHWRVGSQLQVTQRRDAGFGWPEDVE